ncbi:RHS repeat-associated core domain-containing protein [Nonomuraea wenchangensis]|uniref:RHS repeat-associated core domain-containing protein n=1 Tax=Nonomuraea wenchangensis TaxID=568860 RepID=UPI0034334831
MVGLGWNLSAGFIERKYRRCTAWKEYDPNTADLIWYADENGPYGPAVCWESPDELATDVTNAVTAITRPTGTDTYGYDNAGRLVARTVGGKQATFTWNALGQVDKAVVDGQETSMIYGADGERLIRRDPDGSSTLYLGSMEVRASAAGLKATRYYSGPDDAVVAMRTGTSLKWMASGLHGSTQLAIDDTTGQASRKRYLPFGQRRGGDDLPFTDRGFLGKTEDASTDLTYLSARYYDPSTAKFISTDPLLDLSSPNGPIPTPTRATIPSAPRTRAG